MNDRRKGLRENIVVMTKSGERHSYKLCVALINTKYPDGTPRLMTLLKPKEVVDLAGGEEFMTFYSPMHMIGDG